MLFSCHAPPRATVKTTPRGLHRRLDIDPITRSDRFYSALPS
jgi:hypothetical protein